MELIITLFSIKYYLINMVRLTIDFIKKISYKPYSSPEKTEDSLKKITHLNLSEKQIDSIVKYRMINLFATYTL